MHRTLTAIDREWDELVGSHEATLAMDRWRLIDPAIGEFADLQELLVIRSDRWRAQPVLLVLANQSHAGDRIATRVMLQALLPGVVRLAVDFAGRHPDALDELVGLAWERISTYPVHRPGSVAANVLRDIRKEFLRSRSRCRQVPARSRKPSEDTAEDVALGRICALEELEAARRAGDITDLAFLVLVRTRLDDVSLAAVADERRRSLHAVKQVRIRAERRMREILEGRIAA